MAGQAQLVTRLPQIDTLDAKRQERQDMAPPEGLRQSCVSKNQRRRGIAGTIRENRLKHGRCARDRRPLP